MMYQMAKLIWPHQMYIYYGSFTL